MQATGLGIDFNFMDIYPFEGPMVVLPLASI